MPNNDSQETGKATSDTRTKLAQIRRLEATMEKLSDDELKRKTQELKERLHGGKASAGST